MDLFFLLLSNITQKISFLKQDFTGFSIDYLVFINFAINLSLAILLIFVSFSLGRKILNYFTKEIDEKDFGYLIYIAFGYILIGSTVAILGLFSLLNPIAISLLIVFTLFFTFAFPISIKENAFSFYNSFKKTINHLKTNRLVYIGVIIFIMLALTNLINPEIREDQYHVDLPRIYLQAETTMIPPKEDLHVSGSSLLSEMFYIVSIFLTSKESARYIHFAFYILVLLVLTEFSKIKDYKFAIYTPLLLASAPEIIHETSSMYVDFQWMFNFLLSILALLSAKKINFSILAISGFLLGGMIATKLWTIVFIPVAIVFLFIILENETIKKKKLNILNFIFFISLAPILWFLRAFILTGNPLYPAFTSQTLLDSTKWSLPLSHYIGLNYAIFNPSFYINVFSPLFFLGLLFVLYSLRNNLKIIKNVLIFKFLLLLFAVYLFIIYPYGRYLLGLYILFIFLASLGINGFISRFKKFDYFLYIIVLVIFSYYFVNSILALPYSLGMSNKNNYLSRILIRDNSSYYNFGNKFDKYISNKDLVAMYNFHGYYYANFKYIDINYIFDNEKKKFNLLKQNGVTKFLIRGGDIEWFCKKINIKDCNPESFSLISSYLEYPYYYLYNIK